MKKYEIGSELWQVMCEGMHQRDHGMASNPYSLDLLEKHEAWQTGWQLADDAVNKEEY